MPLFYVTQTESRLILSKTRGTQLWQLAITAAFTLFFGYAAVQALNGQGDYNATVSSCLFAFALYALVREVRIVTRGETWTFDKEIKRVLRNGKSSLTFEQIRCLRLSKNDRWGLTIEPLKGWPKDLGDASTPADWNELIQLAEKISDFTDIPICRDY